MQSQEKFNNSTEMDYRHMPESIQAVFREWDADGSGTVGAGDLASAAKAYSKIKQEGRMMKKIIFGMAIVVLLLMVGMFALSYTAAEMTKEMRGKSDGTMQTSDGTVVKVGSSDFKCWTTARS